MGSLCSLEDLRNPSAGSVSTLGEDMLVIGDLGTLGLGENRGNTSGFTTVGGGGSRGEERTGKVSSETGKLAGKSLDIGVE